MKDRLRGIARLLVILVGIGILVYPSLSEYLAEIHGSRTTASYDDSVSKLQQQQLDELLAEAQEYNRKLAEQSDGLDIIDNTESEDKSDPYWQLLNIDDTGMMGYITIPRLNTTIPIYHGTSESLLQVGVGHMESTSLPVGGESTHAALSGHRGLPTASLFTDLDQMQLGDQFYIKVLGQTLDYEVDQILTVLPDETEALAITPGKDYVTLVTCTPYGVNSHRLLVRGHRIPYTEEATAEAAATQSPDSWFRTLPIQFRHGLIGAAVILVIVLLRRLVMLLYRKCKKRR